MIAIRVRLVRRECLSMLRFFSRLVNDREHLYSLEGWALEMFVNGLYVFFAIKDGL